MKKVEAIIRPHLLDAVRDALCEVDVTGMTVSEVKGRGSEKLPCEIYRGAEYNIEYILRTKIEVVIPDDIEAEVVQAIMKTAHTGKSGDGKIFVTQMEEVLRIRTGERDVAAV